jgi:hypothetical protein
MENDGELLQGRNSICNNGFILPWKNFGRGPPNTLVTLTRPYPLVTFRLSLSFLAFDQY